MFVLVYVIVQVLCASILTHMCYIFPRKSRQFSTQRRHNSDSFIHLTDDKRICIDIDEQLLNDVF